MIDPCELQKVFDALPWPEGAKPVLKAMRRGTLFAVLLHEPLSRKWTDIAAAEAPTPDSAFRAVLERWVEVRKPMNAPEFHQAIKRLWS